MYTYDAERFRTEFQRSFTWLAGFLRNVRRDPAHPAAFDAGSGEVWSYGALNEEANRLASALRAHGVGPGDLVLYQLYNSLPFLL